VSSRTNIREPRAAATSRVTRSHGSTAHQTRTRSRPSSTQRVRTTEQRQRHLQPVQTQQKKISKLPVRRASFIAAPSLKKRLRWALGILLLLLAVLVAQVSRLQVFGGDKFRAAGIDNRVRATILPAERGAIFDRTGQEIAMSVPMMTLYADPKAVTDPAGTAKAVAGLMRFDATKEQELATTFAARKSNFSFIARQVDPKIVQSITALKLPGIGAYEEPARTIVGVSAKSVVGKTDTDGVGTAGLELKYNDILTGKNGRFVREQDNQGRSIPGSNSMEVQPRPGEDLVLTLDRSIQYQVDQLLVEQVAKVGARGGVAMVMNSKTGDIYAMANVRRNADGTLTNTSGNFAAVDSHETGSVAKVFSLAATINEGAITPDSTFHVPGAQTFDKYLIRDAYPHPLQEMSVKEILVKSSNLGTVLAAQRISSPTLASYLHAFGFGAKSDLDLPDESAGILKPVKKWQGTEKITVAYGYGFASTSVQLLSAVNVIANNGVYVAPRMVSAVIDQSGKTKYLEQSSTHEVLKSTTAQEMNLMMRDVVCYGTGTLAQIPGMTIAGKTGTGYKIQSDGTYGTDQGGRKYFASFVGFLPAEDPQVTVLVSIDEPDAGSRDRFGGTAAAPVFAQIGGVVARELRIKPAATTQPCGRVDPYARANEAAH